MEQRTQCGDFATSVISQVARISRFRLQLSPTTTASPETPRVPQRAVRGRKTPKSGGYSRPQRKRRRGAAPVTCVFVRSAWPPIVRLSRPGEGSWRKTKGRSSKITATPKRSGEAETTRQHPRLGASMGSLHDWSERRGQDVG